MGQADDSDGIKAILAAGTVASAPSGPFAWTALHVASGYGADSAIETLLAAGVAVDVRSNDGETPLHIAAQEGREAAVRLLLAHAADPNATNHDGETALDARADLSLTNASGSAARDLASQNGHTDLVKLLDTRSKLISRRAKASASTSNVPSSGPAGVEEDTRDMDSLLAALGERTAAAGSGAGALGKSKKKGNAKASGTRANAPTGGYSEGNSGSGGHQVSPASAADNLPESRDGHGENAEPATGHDVLARAQNFAAARTDKQEQVKGKDVAAAGAVDSSKQAKKAEPEKQRGPKSAKQLATPDSRASTDRLTFLRERLQEIDRTRKALDTEELSLRREVMSLESS